MPPVGHNGPMTTPTDPARYAGADLRLAAVDMDGTLLDDDKNFPPGMDELLDQMGLVREATSGPDGIDGGLVMCGKQFAYVERTDDRFVDGVLPYYHRTKRVDDQIAIIDGIEAGQIDDAIVKLAVYVIGPVQALAEATLARFADTHQYAISGANWADLQIRGVDKGSAVRDLQRFLGVTREQTAVFGDAGNDLSMMSEGDLSFAMANASQDVVEASRFIAPSNNEAGVAQVLRTLLG